MNQLNLRSSWIRVTRRHPCPICHHADWCGISANGLIACCMRVDSGRPARNGGSIHRLSEGVAPATLRPIRPAIVARPLDAARLLACWRQGTDAGRVDAHAAVLGVAPAALRRLGIAWARRPRAWAFPMRDEREAIVGIRLRAEGGRKWAVSGSHSGLFIPTRLSGAEPLLICEGPTDTAAALTLGFDAIGRPSCEGNLETVVGWLCDRPYPEVVILADNDAPGLRGARKLAAVLRHPCRMVVPPCKDIREWVRLGATRADVEAVVASCNLETFSTELERGGSDGSETHQSPAQEQKSR